MLHVDANPARRASTSSALSHADSFHSLPPSSHESVHDQDAHGTAVTLPHSGAHFPSTIDKASHLPGYCSSGPVVDNDEQPALHVVAMERQDSKFTIASSSTSTRRMSTSKRASMSPTTSRRPSVSRHSTSFSQSGLHRPQLGSRRNTQTQEDAYAAHARACALFPSTRSAKSEARVASTPASQASLLTRNSQAALISSDESSDQGQQRKTMAHSRATSNAGTASTHRNGLSAETILRSASDALATVQSETVMDWTDPTTRRQTYEEYDKDRKGMRGLWRKITPECFWRGSRVEFYDKENEDDDAKSVRRHRLALDDLKDDPVMEEADEKLDTRQQAPTLSRPGYKRSWSCFGTAAGQ